MASDSFVIQSGKVRFFENDTVIILLASSLQISPGSPTELTTKSGFYIACGLLYLAEKIRKGEAIDKNNSYFEVEGGDVYVYGDGNSIFLKAADQFHKDAPPAKLTVEEAAEFGKKLFELAHKIWLIDNIWAN